MLDAVSLVQSYLRINGFLTVTEFPILHQRENGEFKEVTEVDVLAVRLSEAGRVLPRPRLDAGAKMSNDSVLDLRWGRQELIIAEVKEGVARLNEAMFHRPILREAIRRFGACPRNELDGVIDALHSTGTATLSDGTRVRLMAFASRAPTKTPKVPFEYVALGDVIAFIKKYVRAHWEIQNSAPFRDPVLRFMALLEKGDAVDS